MSHALVLYASEQAQGIGLAAMDALHVLAILHPYYPCLPDVAPSVHLTAIEMPVIQPHDIAGLHRATRATSA